MASALAGGLFVLSFLLPPIAVVIGVALLTVPRRRATEAATVARVSAHAH